MSEPTQVSITLVGENAPAQVTVSNMAPSNVQVSMPDPIGTAIPTYGVVGPQGPTGPTGATGATGAAGPGVAVGGTANQVLTKIDGTNYNTQWTTVDNAFVGLGNVTNVAQLPLSYLDTDGTLAANSDVKVASQKAVRTYITATLANYALLSGATFTGAISATNLSGTNTGNVTLAAVGSTPSANAASISGQVLTLQPVDSTHPGVLTAAQYNSFVAKLSSSLTQSSMYIGSSSNTAIAAAMGGDATLAWNASAPNARLTVNSIQGHTFLNNGYTGDTVVGRDGSGFVYAEGIQVNGLGNGSIFGLKGLYDKDDFVVADLNGVRQFYKTDGNLSLDLDLGIFGNGTDNATIDVLSGILTASDGSTSVDFKNRTLVDAANSTTLHWDEDVLEITKKITSYNGEATQGNGAPAILGYAADFSVSGTDLTVYTAPGEGRLVEVSVTLEILSTGDSFDLLVDYTTDTNTYTGTVMADIDATNPGVVIGNVGSPRYKEGSATFTIPLKTSNAIRIYSANFAGAAPTFNIEITAERLN